MSLAGRTVLITGASQGIGLGVARLAADLGANMNAEGLEAACRHFADDRILTAPGDVADPEIRGDSRRTGRCAVRDRGWAREYCRDHPGRHDRQMSLAQWEQVLRVHLTGAFLCMQAVGRRLIARHKAGEKTEGAIVNVSSDAGRQGTIGQINYSAANAGILGATMSAAREWARYGVRVNTA